MKQVITVVVMMVILLTAFTVSAIELKKIHTDSWVVNMDVMPVGSIKKFVDGSVVCYIYQTHDAISCVKK